MAKGVSVKTHVEPLEAIKVQCQADAPLKGVKPLKGQTVKSDGGTPSKCLMLH